MAVPRPFAGVQGQDLWCRTAHRGTALHPATGAVQLAWETESETAGTATAVAAAGLAFDALCRLYRSRPGDGQVERLLWAAHDPLKPAAEAPRPLDLFAAPPPLALGDFVTEAEGEPALAEPRGLAVDDEGRLFVAETGAARILVYDLWQERVLRRVATAPARPLDLATDGRRVWAVVDAEPWLLELEAASGPRPLALPAGLGTPSRVACAPGGELYLLTEAGGEDACIVPLAQPADRLEEPWAGDLALFPGERQATVLVVARRPGEDFQRYSLAGQSQSQLPPLRAWGYDGGGIAPTPDGRVAYWSGGGLRHAAAVRPRYLRRGRLITFRLDSGEFQTEWGRLFLDACIPRSTTVRFDAVTADEVPEGAAAVARTPPANVRTLVLTRPDLSPPMPPRSFVPADDQELGRKLHRRRSGRELPWTEPGPDAPFATWEAPLPTAPGRYLWVTLELAGNTRSTPRIKSLRAEHPGHDLRRRLPRVYSRQAPMADFLRRFLALFDGCLADLDARATARRALLDPQSAPPELLPWLAGFLGLVLDQRWPEKARRRLIAEAAWLFRFRGTVPGLRRFLGIYLGREPILIEHFRVRGLGGAFVGAASEPHSRAVLGAGFRVGGRMGRPGEVAILGQETDFDAHAHHFSVVLPTRLEPEQLAAVKHILRFQRPAHTLYDLCHVDAGMRVGVGLYTGLTSIVGRTAGFHPLLVGGALVGRGGVLGRARPGTRPGSSRLERDSRVG